jgi:hypothetical protein
VDTLRSFLSKFFKSQSEERLRASIHSKWVDEDFISFLFYFLNDDFKNLPVHVIFCDDIIVAKEYLSNKPEHYWKAVENGKIGATFDKNVNTILLYLNHGEKLGDFLKLTLAFRFYHELRHAYQYFRMKEIYDYESKLYNPDVTMPGYRNQWLEQDANYFAYKTISENKEMFSKKCNIQNWKMDEFKPPAKHKKSL